MKNIKNHMFFIDFLPASESLDKTDENKKRFAKGFLAGVFPPIL